MPDLGMLIGAFLPGLVVATVDKDADQPTKIQGCDQAASKIMTVVDRPKGSDQHARSENEGHVEADISPTIHPTNGQVLLNDPVSLLLLR